MRDQTVVFEALGRMSREVTPVYAYCEDEVYWSLHMQTAKWVCGQMLLRE